MTDRTHVRTLLAGLASIAIAAALTACTSAAPNPDPDPDPDPGSLTITVTGLPVGVDADVTVTGPDGYVQAVVATTSLDDLTPGAYAVTAAAVEGGAGLLTPTVDPPLVNVPEGGAAATSVAYAAGDLPDDGDSVIDPSVWALFRPTSGAPVWVDRPLFNEADPLDVRGLEYRNEVGDPADAEDWLQFTLGHGDGPSTTITVSMVCAVELRNGVPVASTVRAVVRDLDGSQVGQIVFCGGSQDVTIPNVGGSTEHRIQVYSAFADPFYARYALSVDAYCFGGCTYAPLEP